MTDCAATPTPTSSGTATPEFRTATNSPAPAMSQNPVHHRDHHGAARRDAAPPPNELASEQSALGGFVAELSRKVSVEASVGPIALYAARSRSGSVGQRPAGVSFAEGVLDTEARARERGAGRGGAWADLPRIDSEKMLAPCGAENAGAEGGEDAHMYTGPLNSMRRRSCDTAHTHATAVADDDGPDRLDDKEPDEKDRAEKRRAADEESVLESRAPQLARAPSQHGTIRTVEEMEDELAAGMSRGHKITLLAAIMLAVLMSAMMGSAIILTIPSMARDLAVSQLEAQWVSSAYALAYGCTLLFAGRMADIWGRKYLFVGGLAGAAVFTIVSGVVRSHIPLCVVRALAGVGLAVATPAGFGIIGVTFRHEPERTIAFAVFGLGNPVGASVGMLLGGAVSGINAHGWQYVYFVLGGLAVIPAALGLWVIPRDVRGKDTDKRVDWLGGLLITAALCLLTFSITESGIAPRGWRAPHVPALLALSVVLLAAFGFWEHHVEHRLSLPPIAKLSLFTRNGGKVSVILLCAFCPFIAISAWVYLVSLFYQEYKGMSALGNAIHTLPASLAGIGAALAVMYIVPRVRAPFVLMAGGFLSGMACILYAIVPPGTSYWACEFIALLCLPFGADLTVGIGSILMSNLCAEDEQSVAGALFQTATQVAGALGICISSLVQNDVARRTDSYLTGLRHSFGMAAAWSFAVVVFAALFLRKMGLAKDVGRGTAAH